jgi:hypothetical protein
LTKDDITDWLNEPVTRRFMERLRFALNSRLINVHNCVLNANANQAAVEAGYVSALQYILVEENLKTDLADEEAEETADG